MFRSEVAVDVMEGWTSHIVMRNMVTIVRELVEEEVFLVLLKFVASVVDLLDV